MPYYDMAKHIVNDEPLDDYDNKLFGMTEKQLAREVKKWRDKGAFDGVSANLPEPERSYELGNCVYVVQPRGRAGIFKIGVSRNLDKRISGMQTSIPEKLDVILQITGRDDIWHGFYPENLEKELHELFAEQRMEGEWFRLDDKNFHDELLYAVEIRFKVLKFTEPLF